MESRRDTGSESRIEYALMGCTADELCRRADVIDTQHRYAFGIDLRDWPLYRSVFTDRVQFDFTSWYGGDPFQMGADEWVSRVAARQSGFDATQHQMSNHAVLLQGDRAKCTTYVVARHYMRIDGEHHVQAIGGYYSNELIQLDTGWRIEVCRLTVLWTTGDRNLFARAADRMSESSER
jgi:hypothetical protein